MCSSTSCTLSNSGLFMPVFQHDRDGILRSKPNSNNTPKLHVMANLNRVLLIGNLTRDPEVRYTPKGTAVSDLGLAINRVINSEDGERREEVTYVDVTLWGRQAEIAREYLAKGRGVFIEGRLQLDSW